jgi:serine/threonine protein kinase
MIGKILGNCRILKKLGEGGMGSVYLARDLTLEREVAVKIISPELARNPALMARFRVEAIAQAKLNHTNIVTIHSFDQEKDIYYIVMEHVEGKTLKYFTRERGKIPPPEALKIFTQLLDGMAYAHSKGVVHRDIKPSNIFLDKHQTVKIGDFGIAKVEGIEGLTKLGTSMGSPVYSSPEQLLGKKVDARTDVYSLGITLYEMLTGGPPLKVTQEGNYEAIKQTLEFVPRHPSALDPGIPAALDAVVMKSITKDPGERFQSVKEFKKALEQSTASLMAVPSVPSVPPAPARPKEKKKVPRKTIKLPHIPLPLSKGKGLPPWAAAAVLVIIVIAVIAILIGTGGSTIPVQTGSSSTGQKDSQLPEGKSVGDMPRIIQPDSPKGSQPKGEPEKPGPLTSGEFPKIIGDSKANTAEIVKKMGWLIRKNYYDRAVNLGKEAVKNGNISGEIYLEIARAYFYDGNKEQAAVYYSKTLEVSQYISFSARYRYEKKEYTGGTLVIERKTLSFNARTRSGAGASSRYGFSLPLARVKRVSEDFTSDIVDVFKKKKNRKNPVLIIRDQDKNRYVLELSRDDNKLRSFIKHIIDTLRSA